jgi:hypothetical protein
MMRPFIIAGAAGDSAARLVTHGGLHGLRAELPMHQFTGLHRLTSHC